MPALLHPPTLTAIDLPPRLATLAAETEVLVVGGGPAGLGAALGAAWAGARVILVERYGFLGGNATAALVVPFMSCYTACGASGPAPTRLAMLCPIDHGPGEPVIGGALTVLLERLVRVGGAIPASLETGYVVPFDPEIFKLVAMDLLDEAGVQYLFHALASGALVDEQIDGVVFETKSGPLVIRAQAVVDCTGDGDVAAEAGVPYEVGREEDGLVQPMTLLFRMAQFEREKFGAYAREHPDQWEGVHGLWELVREAAAAGELQPPREDILMFATPYEQEVSINGTRVTRVLGSDVWDLTYAEWQGRTQMRQIVRFLQRHVPGFERSHIAQSGVTVGVRESRRIVGDYTLTAEDVLSARKFDDVIARNTYPIDIHDPSGKGTVMKRLPPGESYDIPLRCLLPLGLEGLLVAGRCISGDHEAHSSYRVMPASVATGQAAGVCAALAARQRRWPRDLPARQVQEELIRQGANLGHAQSAAGGPGSVDI